jgi:hypothetical protein
MAYLEDLGHEFLVEVKDEAEAEELGNLIAI